MCYKIAITGRTGKNKYSACKIWESSSINLKYLKVDNSFQDFEKKTSHMIFLILLGENCLGEICKSFCELFQALTALTMIEFLP